MQLKRVLVFDSAIGTSNLGDEIIFWSTMKGIHSIIGSSQVFRLGTHIENYSPLQLLKPSDKIKETVFKADLKLVCGTNLICDDLLTRNPQFMINPINSVLYQDAVFVSVGRNKDFYRFSNFYSEKLYSNTFNHSFLHSTRDEATKVLLNSIGINAINTGCSTLWGMNKEKCKRIPIEKAENVITTVSGQKKYHDFEADNFMINCLIKNYKNVYVFFQTTKDESYFRSLVNAEENGIHCIYSLDEYASILSEGNVDYVGTRLHGGAFALQHDIRTLIISIDQRAEGIFKSNNIPILRRRDIKDLDRVINNNIVTDIKIDNRAIDTFIEQFSK